MLFGRERVFDAAGGMVSDPSMVPAGAPAALIVQLNGVFEGASSWGLSWTVRQAQLTSARPGQDLSRRAWTPRAPAPAAEACLLDSDDDA